MWSYNKCKRIILLKVRTPVLITKDGENLTVDKLINLKAKKKDEGETNIIFY